MACAVSWFGLVIAGLRFCLILWKVWSCGDVAGYGGCGLELVGFVLICG